MKPYIVTRGEKIVKDEGLIKSPVLFSQKLLDLKAEMDNMVSQSFSNDIQFTKCRDYSFSQFMNECNETPYHLAYFTDEELTRGLKSSSDDDIDKRLSAIIRLFCCLDGRDIYIKAYTKFLA